MRDITFSGTSSQDGFIKCHAMLGDFEIMNAKCTTLKLDNQKNGWKGMCVNQKHDGDKVFCGTQGLGRQYSHIRKHTQDQNMLLSAY